MARKHVDATDQWAHMLATFLFWQSSQLEAKRPTSLFMPDHTNCEVSRRREPQTQDETGSARRQKLDGGRSGQSTPVEGEQRSASPLGRCRFSTWNHESRAKAAVAGQAACMGKSWAVSRKGSFVNNTFRLFNVLNSLIN